MKSCTKYNDMFNWKGELIIPKFYLTRHTDNWRFLLEKLSGFRIQWTDSPEIPKNTDVVMSYAIPHHGFEWYPIEPFLKLPKEKKLIVYMRDMQCYGNDSCKKRRFAMMKRANKILVWAEDYFKKMFPEFIDKMIFIPQFWAPYERYFHLRYNQDPLMKCLIIGATNPKWYPIRATIIRNGDPNLIDYLPSPVEMKHDVIKDKYAQFLNKYFCSIVDSSIFDYVVAKYFEIPAAGSLLLAEYTPDLDDLGFIPYFHYVPITQENALRTIREVLKNPERYEPIRAAGRNFVEKEHGINNRYYQLKSLLDEMGFKQRG